MSSTTSVVTRTPASSSWSINMRVCVASKEPRERAETFIRTHMNKLPFSVRVLSGIPPQFDEHEGFVGTAGLFARIRNRLRRVTFEQWLLESQVSYLRKSGAALVLAEYGQVGVTMTQACAAAGVPLVVHFHGNDAHNHQSAGEWREGYLRLFSVARAIVAVSHDMRNHLIALGAAPEKVVRIPYWVDPERFTGAEPGKSPPKFLAVGRFVEKKAPHLTVLAFAEVLRQHPDALLTMIGSGPLLGPCRQLATVMGIADRIVFLGQQDHVRVAEEMRGARAFVQHSVQASDGDCEGTPVAILESQASGLPVISTRHTGIKEAVVHEQTGLLVDELDVRGMTDAMCRLVRDPNEAAAFGENGRRHIAEHYSRAQTLDRLARLLQDVGERRSP